MYLNSSELPGALAYKVKNKKVLLNSAKSLGMISEMFFNVFRVIFKY